MMRWWLLSICLLLVAGLAVGEDQPKTEKPKATAKEKKAADPDTVELDVGTTGNPLGKKATDPKELIKKVSYLMGSGIGKQLRGDKSMEFDKDELFRGLEETLQGKETKYSQKEMQEIFQAFQQYQVAKAQKLAAELQKAGEELLESNQKKDGVKVLPSGLQYRVLATGKGASPKATDTVRVHYRGKLVNGKVFDQSFEGDAPTKEDQPAEFPVNGVIKGWTEALQKMKPGDKWELVIPSAMAYGKNGSPQGGIGPNQVLIFDVELIAVVE